MIGVNVEGQHLIVIRDEDRFFAAERACPHEGPISRKAVVRAPDSIARVILPGSIWTAVRYRQDGRSARLTFTQCVSWEAISGSILRA